jgi:hypothetical protein
MAVQVGTAANELFTISVGTPDEDYMFGGGTLLGSGALRD